MTHPAATAQRHGLCVPGHVTRRLETFFPGEDTGEFLTGVCSAPTSSSFWTVLALLLQEDAPPATVCQGVLQLPAVLRG